MPETTYTFARAHLAALCKQVAEDREAVIIRRRNGEDVALVSAAELSSLMETAHLLRSPENAKRLLRSLEQAYKGEGVPQTVGELRQEVGLDDRAASG